MASALASCLRVGAAAALGPCGFGPPHLLSRLLPALPVADQMCLWCYHHILEEAAKASLAARCPNCRAEYDEEKIQMQHIDAEQ